MAGRSGRAPRSLTRTAALTTLWRALRGARSPGGAGIGTRLRAVPRLVGATLTGRYRDLGFGRLGLMALAALYVLSPVDVLPELVLPLLGLGDDALVLAWLAGTLLDETDRFVTWERTASPRPHAPSDTAPAVVQGHVLR